MFSALSRVQGSKMQLFQGLNTVRLNIVRTMCAGLEDEYKKEISDVTKAYEEKKRIRQSMVGKVVATKCAKSCTIAVQKRKYISKYKAYLRYTKKVMIHDEEEICRVGDIIRAVSCQQKSKKKKHRLYEILWKEPRLDFDAETIARSRRERAEKNA
mmetsp:Transcript_26706/g.39679  ORF Transcript_26706/g.39679 Transcript_26706/m.39679 type:complete len:156 (+) Transcript_26706:87-554(+)|eukprot:CAMPEP_0185018584 /NCGR_PEP_ID=MMETSP1103-20130426/1258_1 /TAXON_ID=36769 /ORGANISM="Paraphysomonas bandaiensis, Strain Caron Lab Isolate" /LENGTH=155 /DNA_ID=CAMNT_0027548439 /DNA_START=73 /DNA_END=540 /DNA_ORIENTATION=+